MCFSAVKGRDSCNYTTNSETFYIRVLAYSDLSGVTLKIIGVNNFEVQELEEDTNGAMESTTPFFTESNRKLFYSKAHFFYSIPNS